MHGQNLDIGVLDRIELALSTVVPTMAATMTRWEAPIFYRRLAASIGEEVVGFKHESNICDPVQIQWIDGTRVHAA
jgi:hypothetical protein